jgi:predicted deacylase
VVTVTPQSRAERGPVVVVTANVHGDECTGAGAVLRLLPILEAELMHGAVHLYPSLNPDGLERRVRRVPEDDQDLNRQFPGDASGTPAERLAHAAWTDIAARQPDLLIDLHADAPGALPYTLVDRAVALKGEPRRALEAASLNAARATGLTVVNEYPDDRYLRFRLDRSLSGAALNRLRTPAITIEAGPRLVLDADAVALTVTAVLGALSSLGMLSAPAAPHPQRVDGGPWRRDNGPRASTTGLLVPRARVGALLERGEVVAEVRAFSGALLEEVLAESRGFLLAPAERSHVVAGVSVCTWAQADPS